MVVEHRSEKKQGGRDKTRRSPLLLIAIAWCLLVASMAGARLWLTRASARASATPQSATHAGNSNRGSSNSRNLAMRPEAHKLSRQLGKRFKQRSESVLTGTLTAGGERRHVRLIRSQEEDGERVEVALTGAGGGRASFVWNAEEGVRATDGSNVSDDERLIIERLVFDSPDYFVLAQLRGASYYTLMRHVRPAEAGGDDNYSGATWDVVRVSEPTAGGGRSVWRLFYINTATGLLDRVVSPISDGAVTAEFAGWTEQEGERSPRAMVWRRGAEAVMELSVTGVAHQRRR